MKKFYRIKLNNEFSNIKMLSNARIVHLPYVVASKEELGVDIFNSLEQKAENITHVFSEFSEKEIKSADFWVLKQFDEKEINPEGDLNIKNDGLDYLRFAYEGFCENCYLPLGDQVNSIVITSEDFVINDHDLFFSGIRKPRLLFTTKDKSYLFKNEFGIDSRDVFVGKNKIISTKIVQLVVPISSSPLNFNGGSFGVKLKKEVHRGDHSCPDCNLSIYSPEQLGYFPFFENHPNFDFMFTKEWFSFYRHLIIGKRAKKFMIEKGFIKETNEYLIPLK